MTDRPRCKACGAVLALNPGTLCRPCLAKRRAQVEIPDFVLALLENADEHSIELVAKLIIGQLKDTPVGNYDEARWTRVGASERRDVVSGLERMSEISMSAATRPS